VIRLYAQAALLILSGGSLYAQATSDAISRLPRPEHWKTHLLLELLPFWETDAAVGNPVGNFPSTRCDDGTAVNWNDPCPEVGQDSWLMARQQYLVSVSRQTYGYGVAFHLSGDSRYLAQMKAGVDYIRQNFVDRTGGGLFTEREADGSFGPPREYRNPQELAYGLLGMGFYYYLTRDPDVLQDILAVKRYIFANYYNQGLDALNWMLASTDATPYDHMALVAQLDNMNAYLVLLTPIIPEPDRTEWKASLVQLSRMIIKRFYSANQNLMFLSGDTSADTDIAQSGTDFGHTIKSMWMIRMAGLLTNRADLVQFSETNGPRVLERAYLRDSGSWAEGVLAGAVMDPNKSWWIYAELDQYTASLAMSQPELAAYLPDTYRYWLSTFVDKQYGEVWNGIDAATNLPQKNEPKAWPWKSAYHTFEHSLVAYISTAQLKGKPVLLFYAFPTLPEVIRPYFYSGTMVEAIPAGDPGTNTWAITFKDVH
jgi:mannose/cellobiose epimerase-like protein (N-acyl-D-glucosamine 2-epimerase family)